MLDPITLGIILEHYLRSSYFLSLGIIPRNASPAIQLLYVIVFTLVVVHVVSEIVVCRFLLKKELAAMEIRARVPWFPEVVKVLAFGDAKVGKTSLLKMFSPTDDLTWRSDLGPEGSTSYRSFDTGYIWIEGGASKDVIKSVVVDSDADVFTTTAISGGHYEIPCDPDVVLLCFSLTNRASFESVSKLWYTGLRNRNVQAPVVLVGTHLDKRGIVDLDSYLGQGVDYVSNVEDFVTRKEGLDLMKKIDAISYIEYSHNRHGANDLISKTTQAGLFYKHNHKGFWRNYTKRFWDALLRRAPAAPPPPPPPPLPLSAVPNPPSEVWMGPLTLMASRGHHRALYGCLRNNNTGVRIYYYIKSTGVRRQVLIIIVVVQEESLSQVDTWPTLAADMDGHLPRLGLALGGLP